MNMAIQNSDIRTESETRISWGGILAGVLVATIVGALIGLLGVSLGATTFSLDKNTLTEITAKSAIWFILNGVISMYLGGWVAGYFNRSKDILNSFIHGLLTYCLATLFGFLVFTASIAFFINGAFNLLETSFTAANTAVESLCKSTEGGVSNAMSKAQELTKSISPDLASGTPSTEDKEHAKAVAQEAINTMGYVALTNFIILIVGAASAGVGGVMGARNRFKI